MGAHQALGHSFMQMVVEELKQMIQVSKKLIQMENVCSGRISSQLYTEKLKYSGLVLN